MKVECPICGIGGFLQKRGNSYRIQHYKGYVDGKRIYEYHRIPTYQMEVIGSKNLEVNKAALLQKGAGGGI